MEIETLAEMNSWWVSGTVPESLKGEPRSEYRMLLDALDVREITIITGIRRAGKSTFMYQMADGLISRGVSPKQILFLNLEDARLKEYDMDTIYEEYRKEINPDKKAYLFLDEIHKKDGWEDWVRRHYDLHSDVKFVVSGSCSHLLKKEYATLLTGRNLSFEVFPLSFAEFLGFRRIKANRERIGKGIVLPEERYQIENSLGEYLHIGGFPAVFFQSAEFKTKTLAQYFDDILYKDIVDRYNINSQKAKDLAIYLMTNFTRTIPLRSIRSSLGLSYDAINEYISCFKDAFLFFTIEHFSYSIKEQKTMPSKIYCMDNGLRNAVSFRFSKDDGKLTENLVLVELKRRGAEVFYWKGKGEVDFIVKNNDGTLSAINVCYGDEIAERETKALAEFRERFPKTTEETVITKNIEKKEGKVTYIPLWKFLLGPDKARAQR